MFGLVLVTLDVCYKPAIQKIRKNSMAFLNRSEFVQGVVKPDIVFFGEDLPERFFMYERDLEKADLLLILGTSLEVAGKLFSF